MEVGVLLPSSIRAIKEECPISSLFFTSCSILPFNWEQSATVPVSKSSFLPVEISFPGHYASEFPKSKVVPSLSAPDNSLQDSRSAPDAPSMSPAARDNYDRMLAACYLVIAIYERLRYSDEGLSFLLLWGYPMGCYLKGLVRLFLLEYPLSEAKKNSLLWECPIRMKRPDYLKVPL